MEKRNIREAVRAGYARIAKRGGSCCGSGKPCCADASLAEGVSERIGYTRAELSAVPEGANLGLGCGNPTALASLKPGETVLDLGSGAGLDCFLAAKEVGENGRVIGVDMTPEMVEKARENGRQGGYGNVEFRLGEIEHLPVADASVDVVLSNCVINLSPDKPGVFAEAFRVLRPGGRMMVSDIVLLEELPASVRDSVEAYVGCLSGAMMKADYLEAIGSAGFEGVSIVQESSFPVECVANDPTVVGVIESLGIPAEEVGQLGRSVASVTVHAEKPTEGTR